MGRCWWGGGGQREGEKRDGRGGVRERIVLGVFWPFLRLAVLGFWGRDEEKGKRKSRKKKERERKKRRKKKKRKEIPFGFFISVKFKTHQRRFIKRGGGRDRRERTKGFNGITLLCLCC